MLHVYLGREEDQILSRHTDLHFSCLPLIVEDPVWGQAADRPLYSGQTDRYSTIVYMCAAKALFSCPAIISQRLEPRIISNEPLENTEEESKII
jgi:hypothetical protein